MVQLLTWNEISLLKVPANATVVISYIGMKTQEIAIKGKSKIDVTLSDDAKRWMKL